MFNKADLSYKFEWLNYHKNLYFDPRFEEIKGRLPNTQAVNLSTRIIPTSYTKGRIRR